MEETTKKTSLNQSLILVAQSLSLFLISYYILYFISGISVLYIAYDLDIPAKLFVNTIQFNLHEQSTEWTKDAIISILMVTPVSSFVVGIIAIFIFIISSKKNAILLYGCIWLFLQAFNMTFGLLSENLISQTGLVKVAQQLGVTSIMSILTVGVSAYLLLKSGSLAAKLFFTHSKCVYDCGKYSRQLQSVFFFFIPWIIGSTITLGLAYETVKPKDFILSSFMLLLLLPSLFVKVPELKKILPIRFKPTLILLFLALTISIGSYFILRQGISF